MPTTTTYPNGQTLVSTALTLSQINDLVTELTCGALGINPPDYDLVRTDWQTQGQPSTDSPAKDVCYVDCVLKDDDYARVRDRTASGTGPVVETWTYTRGWHVSWVAYGPNSTDRLRALRSAIFMDYFTDILSLSNLFPLSDPPEVIRAPELINAQWWERADYHVDMYESVTETISDGAVTSVEIRVYDGDPHDPVADVTVTA